MKHRYLVMIPLGFHLAVVILICLAGKLALWPNTLDESGIVLFPDNQEYHLEVVSQAKILTGEGILAFAHTSSPFHLKLYSISFAIFSPLFGNSMLSAEPLNVLVYLVILWLVFKLSRLICSRDVSLIAAGTVAVWPSFLMHTTQLFRDPLFIAAMLALIFVTASWLTGVYSWRAALVRGSAGVASAAVLWMVRGGAQEVVIAIGMVGGMLLLGKQIRGGHFLAANTVGAVIVILACFSVPKIITPYRAPLQPGGNAASPSGEAALPASTPDSGKESPRIADQTGRMAEESGTPAATKIGRLRSRFIDQYPNAGSNIDTDVQFNSTADIVRYLPRALAIGLFAPFPRMWFSQGKHTGAFGRLAGGGETFVMYVIELLAIVGIWKMRRQWATWLLLLVVLIGAISLGLVVTNVGALYRMRYAFWMLLIPLGVEGAVKVRASWAARRKQAVQEMA